MLSFLEVLPCQIFVNGLPKRDISSLGGLPELLQCCKSDAAMARYAIAPFNCSIQGNRFIYSYLIWIPPLLANRVMNDVQMKGIVKVKSDGPYKHMPYTSLASGHMALNVNYAKLGKIDLRHCLRVS